MASNSADNGSDEVEISLEDGAEVQLHEVDVDADARSIEFTVEGVIQNIESDILEALAGATLEPTAVRFRRITNGE